MAEDATTIIDRLEEIEATARKLVEAGKRNDWREAEMALRRVQTTAQRAPACRFSSSLPMARRTRSPTSDSVMAAPSRRD